MSYRALPLLQKLQQTYGGNQIRIKRDPRPSRAETHSWRLIGRPCQPFLSRIIPYLLIKRSQAELAIWLQGQIDATPRGPGKGGPWSEELRAIASRARARMAELNRTGPALRGLPGRTPLAFLEGSAWVSPQMSLDPLPAPFRGPWPSSGAVVDGVAYALPAPDLSRLSHGALLPTPTASDANGPGKHGTGAPDLRTTVSLLPTPTAADSERTSTTYVRGNPTLVGALLPTPTVNGNNNAKGISPTSQDGLMTVVRRVSAGTSTAPRSPAGNTSSGDPRPTPPSPDAAANPS